MKILVSQKGKKLNIEFNWGKAVDKYSVDKADDLLNVLDRFLKKRKIKVESLQKASLKFVNTGMLTERIIRAIITGLRF
ncbi:hypothetical protein A2567_02660 [Candidatus Azambacteria bacterium RIFOXYD1_FULL_42_11]|uniref:Uncharacterized protein n=2 Tax=Candidatus Azamiibacteriota TaxID=1752741 RepID=A0A1F5CG77_9BACT|nr:MAG: hypothetical protein UV07_C0023G0003 [Candidatus Azambacteria bacterium GW2011_GWB1_42_17]KKS88147.1 MAG: hypothetical protein UV62_C0013G0003 [Parcubacteria group bacterium GW2011_GWC1_43_11]OGD41873.1 MAG: hypothetical protein A2567_02660 [Candidatus Azambacteria bacterium RIFOXYD1_FULL_42_11]